MAAMMYEMVNIAEIGAITALRRQRHLKLVPEMATW
jgi:hypothetical protein